MVRIAMLCYPCVTGYGFNPLTVHDGVDDEDRIRLMVYGVNNTFGQRKTRVLPVCENGCEEIIAQKCARETFASAVKPAAGACSFHPKASDAPLSDECAPRPFHLAGRPLQPRPSAPSFAITHVDKSGDRHA
ncbi:DUF1365 family protein [Breoghania sp.]|uniref:DUF1365 family protein n=1 Tax=Breoghania sp. TaxID=2065378 RepID=UPI002AA6B228|nr:DUF1365 family protein [Breoghania sp.]